MGWGQPESSARVESRALSPTFSNLASIAPPIEEADPDLTQQIASWAKKLEQIMFNINPCADVNSTMLQGWYQGGWRACCAICLMVQPVL
jgi:hypothetical protein